MRRRGPIAPQPIGVATQLPQHRRWRPPDDGRDGPDRVTAGPAERDLFPLRQRQTPTLEVPTSTRSDSSHRSQPAAALLAIAAGRDRGIVDELPSRHASPEHLIDLRNHPIREPHHNTLRTRNVAITARTRGSSCATRVKGVWTDRRTRHRPGVLRIRVRQQPRLRGSSSQSLPSRWPAEVAPQPPDPPRCVAAREHACRRAG